jgi:hypothetical protein
MPVPVLEALFDLPNDKVAELDTTVVPMLAKLIGRLTTGAASIKAALEARGLDLRHTTPSCRRPPMWMWQPRRRSWRLHANSSASVRLSNG